MAVKTIPAGDQPFSLGHAANAGVCDLDSQRLRILRCTAQAMAGSPGGLRFKAGTRPWLEGLPAGLSVSGSRKHLRPVAGTQTVAH